MSQVEDEFSTNNAQQMGVIRLLYQGLVDANTLADQALVTTTMPTQALSVTIERVSGGALTLGVFKMGFNGAANDVIASQALVSLAGLGAVIPLTPPQTLAPNGGTLIFKMTTAVGTAATLRVTVTGTGG